MTKRINVVLPVETLRLLDNAVPKRGRSRFISQAVEHFVKGRAKATLARRLREGALTHAQRDLEIAEEWFALDEAAWQNTRRGRRVKQ